MSKQKERLVVTSKTVKKRNKFGTAARRAKLQQRIDERKLMGLQIEAPHVVQMCALFDQGQTVYDIAVLFGVDVKFVLDVTMGKTWGGITRRLPIHTVERNKRFGKKTGYWPEKKAATYPYDSKNPGRLDAAGGEAR